MKIFFHRGLQQGGVGYSGGVVRDAGEVSEPAVFKIIFTLFGVAILTQLERLSVVDDPLVAVADLMDYLNGILAELVVRYERLLNNAVSFELERVVVYFHWVSPSRVAPEGAD
tara:strand:+ start:56 stop:394 length:339 start_codon:yes stop_codon:yes gene_type:complete